MERKFLTRYLILITALMIFAGAAWYFTKDSGAPQAGAVLAGVETQRSDFAGVRGRSRQPGAVSAVSEPTFPLGVEVSHEL